MRALSHREHKQQDLGWNRCYDETYLMAVRFSLSWPLQMDLLDPALGSHERQITDLDLLYQPQMGFELQLLVHLNANLLSKKLKTCVAPQLARNYSKACYVAIAQ